MKSIKLGALWHEPVCEGGCTHLEQLAQRLGLQTEVGRNALEQFLLQAMLMDRKQLDYGSKNISSFGMFGIVVRMNDKFERIKNLFMTRRKQAANESIIDSLWDICNYAVIAILVATNKWPTEARKDENK